ncbi:MAG TPA: hypothetical protein VGN34_21620 [Ktedonobacteraceae bacterium]|jgi:hypothetical protein
MDYHAHFQALADKSIAGEALTHNSVHDLKLFSLFISEGVFALWQ